MTSQEVILNQRYKLLERAGSGGMALVYKAQDLALGRVVAIKLLQDSLIGDAEFLRRFQQEAYAAANLSHPNIVTVHDIGQDGRRHYIVMEFVEGKTLKQLVRETVKQTGKSLNVQYALDLAIQICKGIGYAHRAGLVHCDVKPQNVLVTSDGRVKVADFGIARAMSASQASSLYRPDQVWGTPQYFAPEQAVGEPATPASDVYSIGIILFEMLTGRTPFHADNPTTLALKHVNEPAPLANTIEATIPLQLVQIVNKLLDKEPAGRYRTANQLAQILETYRRGNVQPITPPAATQPAPVHERQTEPPRRVPQLITDRPITPPHNETTQPLRAPAPEPKRIAARPDSDERVPADKWLIFLGILATIMLLGTIPLWFLVYLQWSAS